VTFNKNVAKDLSLKIAKFGIKRGIHLETMDILPRFFAGTYDYSAVPVRTVRIKKTKAAFGKSLFGRDSTSLLTRRVETRVHVSVIFRSLRNKTNILNSELRVGHVRSTETERKSTGLFDAFCSVSCAEENDGNICVRGIGRPEWNKCHVRSLWSLVICLSVWSLATDRRVIRCQQYWLIVHRSLERAVPWSFSRFDVYRINYLFARR